MWRAFFFACGIMLIVLGLQCIIIDRFQISSDSGLNRVARKIFGSDQGSTNSLASTNFQAGLASGANGYGRAQSQFGPSRFGDSPFLNTSVDNRQAMGSPFNLPNHNSGGLPSVQPKRLKTFKTEDWMPWSLIAAGTIISLYTHSLRQGHSTN